MRTRVGTQRAHGAPARRMSNTVMENGAMAPVVTVRPVALAGVRTSPDLSAA